MDIQTKRWLGPMITELLSGPAGNATFARLMHAAVTADGGGGVDWVAFGELIRNELSWNHYPTLSSQGITCA